MDKIQTDCRKGFKNFKSGAFNFDDVKGPAVATLRSDNSGIEHYCYDLATAQGLMDFIDSGSFFLVLRLPDIKEIISKAKVIHVWYKPTSGKRRASRFFLRRNSKARCYLHENDDWSAECEFAADHLDTEAPYSDGRAITSPRNVNSIDKDLSAFSFAEQIIKDLYWCHKTNHTKIVTQDDRWFIFSGTHYSKVPKDSINGDINTYIAARSKKHEKRLASARKLYDLHAAQAPSGREAKLAKIEMENLKGQLPQNSAKYRSEIMAAIQAQARVPHNAKAPCWIDTGLHEECMSFRNARTILTRKFVDCEGDHARSKEYIIEATPELFNLSLIDAPLTSSSLSCPGWMNYLATSIVYEKDGQWIADTETIDAFGKMMAYILDTSLRSRFEIIGVLQGKSGSGKSVALDNIQKLIGKESVCTLQPDEMDGKYNGPPLTQKKLNVVEEMKIAGSRDKSQLDIENMLKKISSGNSIRCEEKYGASWEAAATAFTLAATNSENVSLIDEEQSVTNRMRVIRFPRIFRGTENDNKDLKDLWKTEGAGIIFWMLDHLIQLHKLDQFPDTERMKEVKYNYAFNKFDPKATFIKDYIREPTEGQVANTKIKDIWDAYKKDCEEGNVKTGSRMRFIAHLEKTTGKVVYKDKAKHARIALYLVSETGEGAQEAF